MDKNELFKAKTILGKEKLRQNKIDYALAIIKALDNDYTYFDRLSAELDLEDNELEKMLKLESDEPNSRYDYVYTKVLEMKRERSR